MSDTGSRRYNHYYTAATVAGTVLVAAGVIVLFVLLSGNPASAASDTSNVSINVSRTVAVTVQPDSFAFENMELGSTNFSDVPSHQLIITNDGSVNLTNIYVHMDTLQSENDNPLGTGDAGEYAAGRFLWIKNDSSRFYHAGSLTWNATEKPSGISEPENQESYPPSQAWGFYRNASGDYLWGLAGNATYDDLLGEWDTSGSVCNKTNNLDSGASSTEYGPELRIKNVTDSEDDRDLSDANTTTYNISDSSPGNAWGVARAEKGPLKGHYLAAHSSCEKVYIYRFDADTRFPSSGSEDQYLLNTTLAPGEEYSGRVGAALPQGIPSGSTNQTTLTVHASQG